MTDVLMPSLNSIEDLQQKYGALPENLDLQKINVLIRKRGVGLEPIPNFEQDVLSWLTERNIAFTVQAEPFLDKAGNSHELMSVLIEQGKYPLKIMLVGNYAVFNKRVIHPNTAMDMHKALQDKGVRVIWCKKFEWENPNKRNVLQSLILHVLGLTERRIYARKTVAEVIPNSELKNFFNESSFYGFRSASQAVCLKDKVTGEILQAMSFGHPYYGKDKYGEGSVECIRSAGKPNAVVVGGMTKLMNFYLEQFGHGIKKIVYYVDDAHHQSASMEALGFKFSHFAGPGVHNVFPDTGAMMMRTPSMHKEIMYFQKIGEICGVPDVGNSTFTFDVGTSLGEIGDAGGNF